MLVLVVTLGFVIGPAPAALSLPVRAVGISAEMAIPPEIPAFEAVKSGLDEFSKEYCLSDITSAGENDGEDEDGPRPLRMAGSLDFASMLSRSTSSPGHTSQTLWLIASSSHLNHLRC